jgi:hypothetical protein
MSPDCELTSNQYVALPCIARSDGAIHEVNVLHRGLASLLSWCAVREPVSGATPLLRLRLIVDGEDQAFESPGWERLDRWVPRMRATTPAGIGVTCTICAPGGFDPVVRGAVVLVELENGSAIDRVVSVHFDGCWRWSLATVATTRPLRGVNRLVRGRAEPGIALEAGDGSGGAALGLTAGIEATYAVMAGDAVRALDPGEEVDAPNGVPNRFRIERALRVAAGRRVAVPLFIGVGPERDGALAAATHAERLGGSELIRLGRLELARIGRNAGEKFRDLLGRNLTFHYYCSVARAIDDDRLYPVLSRSPAHGACAVFSERAALGWSLPAHALTDSYVARDLYMRILEQYSDRPGHTRRYIDGAVLAPGFALGHVCEYALALERYLELTSDAQILDEPLVQQVVRELDEMIFNRLHPDIFLAETEVLPSGERADYPYSAFDNVLVWRVCRGLERLLRAREGEPRFRMAGGDEEIAAAFWQRCTADVDGLRVIGYTTDLKGNTAIYDDPAGSLRLLPFLGFCAEDDPIWSNTMDLLHSKRYPLWLGGQRFAGLAGRSRPREASFAALCADLLGPRREQALETLTNLELPGGVACECYDPETGRATNGPYAAAEAGLLVWTLLEERGAGRRDPEKRDRDKRGRDGRKR